MINEAVNAIGVMSSMLDWHDYYALLQHSLHVISKKPDLHRSGKRSY